MENEYYNKNLGTDTGTSNGAGYNTSYGNPSYQNGQNFGNNGYQNGQPYGNNVYQNNQGYGNNSYNQNQPYGNNGGYNQNAPYGNNMQFNQGAYSNQMGQQPVNPNQSSPEYTKYLIMSIVQLICCCRITGILSLVFLSSADSAFKIGDQNEYEKKMKSTKTTLTVGWIIAGTITLIVLAYYVFIGALIFAG